MVQNEKKSSKGPAKKWGTCFFSLWGNFFFFLAVSSASFFSRFCATTPPSMINGSSLDENDGLPLTWLSYRGFFTCLTGEIHHISMTF